MGYRIRVGQTVALCYIGDHDNRRVCNVSVTKIMKTFIEVEDGSRYSTADRRQTQGVGGVKGNKSLYLDPCVSYWDRKVERDDSIKEISRKFTEIANAAVARNWDATKVAFEALKDLIGE